MLQPLENLVRIFVELHPEDAARAFETLEQEDELRLFQKLPPGVLIELINRLSPQTAGPLLRQMESKRVQELISEMTPRAATALLHQLESEQREQVLSGLPEQSARPLRLLVSYPGDTAGAIMEPRVASLSIDLSAQQAIEKIRRTPREVLHYLYVTNRNGKLIGVLNMRDLLLAAPNDPIERLVKRNVLSVPDTLAVEEVISLLRERRFLALPVVDFEGRLIGVVKFDDMLEASQQEAFEDLQLIVGAGADERALSPVSTVVRSRLPWLYVNLATAFLAASVVGLFESIIAQIAALAVLLPVVAGQGGNTGSQSLAVVMRGLALREVIPGVEKRVVRKEVIAAAFNGLAVALVTGLAVFAWRWSAGDPLRAGVTMATVMGLAMVVNMVCAAAAGAVIPLALKALGRDPAQSAAIFLTTVTDVIGFAAFLGFATLFSPLLL